MPGGNACQTEMNGLPILTGCAADTELVLVMNSTASGSVGGYGLRYIKDLKQCFLNNLNFVYNQFQVGQGGSPISDGGTVIAINAPSYLLDSLKVYKDDVLLPRNDNTQVSYTYTYSNGLITITFNNPVSDGEQYVITYAGTLTGSSGGGSATQSANGTSVQSGNGIIGVFQIAHGLGIQPSYINVIAGSSDALASTFFITADATFIYINYSIAPPAGSNNLTFYWYAQK